MRIALSGAGFRAASVLSVLKTAMPEAVVVGYYDPAPSHLDAIGADIPPYPSVAEMLSDTQPDLFFVASPNHVHLEQIQLGLEAGVRVFTEKPVVSTIEDTMKLAALLSQYGADRVMVGLVLRYSQHMIDLRHALDEGVLGPIASLEANEHIAPYHGAFFMRDWRRNTGYSGGFMLEKCCHDLDIYNMITGSRPRRLASFGGRRSFLPDHAPVQNSEAAMFHTKPSVWESTDDPFTSDGDIIDFQTAILDYENGAAATFHTNLNTPDEHRRFCVMGAKGMAEGDFVRGYLRVTRRDGTRFRDHDYSGGAQTGAHYGADQMMANELAAYLRGELAALPVGVVDALEAGIAALALDQARTLGEVVDLTEVWDRFDTYQLRGARLS